MILGVDLLIECKINVSREQENFGRGPIYIYIYTPYETTKGYFGGVSLRKKGEVLPSVDILHAPPLSGFKK